MKKLSQSNCAMQSVLPKNATWLKDRVSRFDPETGSVQTQNGSKIAYEVLVLALGLELRYEKVGRISIRINPIFFVNRTDWLNKC